MHVPQRLSGLALSADIEILVHFMVTFGRAGLSAPSESLIVMLYFHSVLCCARAVLSAKARLGPFAPVACFCLSGTRAPALPIVRGTYALHDLFKVKSGLGKESF